MHKRYTDRSALRAHAILRNCPSEHKRYTDRSALRAHAILRILGIRSFCCAKRLLPRIRSALKQGPCFVRAQQGPCFRSYIVYIMSGMPPGGVIGGAGSLIVATTVSVVSSVEATLVAF